MKIENKILGVKMEQKESNQNSDEIFCSINRKFNVLINLLMLSDSEKNWTKDLDKIQN